MQLWPAIDIRDGRCVRLRQGSFADVTEYGDPLEVAEQYQEAGATHVHVVDLDAARTGEPVNRATIIRLAARTGLVVQAGGGVRSEDRAAALFDGGVARVVVGTALFDTDGAQVLDGMLDRWPGRVVVGLDHRAVLATDGTAKRELAVRGWIDGSGVSLDEAIGRLEGRDVADVVVTDISRDGTGNGPDLSGYEHLLEISSLPIVASGGVGSEADIALLGRLASGDRRLSGVIVGKALLSGALTLAAARDAAAVAAGSP